MPAQSGDDPVSTALHLTLASSKYKMGEMNSLASNNVQLESKIRSTAAEILSAHIKYTSADEYYSPSSAYARLKEKYTVLSAALGCQVGPPCTPTKISSSSSSSLSSSRNSASPPTTDSKKSTQVQTVSTILPQQVASKSANAADSLPLPKKILYPPNLVSLGWKGSVPVGAGFVNLGNTCYLNSALQALLHVPAFVNWLQSDSVHTSQCESINGMTHSECLICAMVKILHNTHKYTGSAIKPLHIYTKLKEICKHLVHGHQEDAHEFLRYLIEGMEKSYLTIFNGMRLDSYSKETTPLNQIFGGYMRTEVTCLECGSVSTTFQHFQDILLDIRQANSVDEALETYFSRERLGDGDQAYKCGQCKRRAAATKKFSIERAPNALCIQLKRFNAMGGKNNKHISVKQTLDMTKFLHPSRATGSSLKYKLVSLVSHLGQSANCGHYTAIGQSAAGSYYHFDDSVVRPVPLQNVLNTNAYIIMYELTESSREKSMAQVTVGTNCVEMKANENLTSQEQPYLKSVIDEPQMSPRISKQHDSQELRSPTASNENDSNPSQKKQNKISSNKSITKHSATSPSESSNVECSLVPYLSESSESESGGENSQVTSRLSSDGMNKSNKNVNKMKQTEDRATKEKSPNTGKIPAVEQKIGGNGWQVSPIKNASSSECNTSTSISGKWSVISQEREPWRNDNEETRHNGTISMSKESGNRYENSRNTSRHSSSSSASSSSPRNNNTKQSLLDMSHQGYGTTNVNSWSGSKSKLSRDIEKERLHSKRPFTSYNDELDRGKAKKKRYHKNNSGENEGNNGWNRAQEFQNRKNCWNSPLNGNSRQNFYRQYTYEKSKNHNSTHNHHSHYRSVGGNYYNRGGGGGGNAFPLTMMVPSLLYKKPHCT